VKQLPVGPGGRVVGWTAVTLTLVLTGGFYLMYRAALRQIALTRQQQDFVSAVSHELKTPLTSIRLYGEMLKEGWATEERRQTYYDYICAESERLTRLIENVLQLARLTRNELRVELKPVPVGELMEGLRPKIATQIERAGFELRLDCPAPNAVVRVDQDFFAQLLINLVDNALKFSRDAECRAVEIGCRMADAHNVRFSVRDYGPGIPSDQMKKIFRLFYRSGNELTRETVGTGIGLALVRQLTLTMNGRVDVVNRDPGAELRLTFPAGPIEPRPPHTP
jgi:two-component system phosphate regulon sensor histidine kinase PhoR